MKILLDESVPVQIGNAFKTHDVFTVQSLGWNGYTNGDLLSSAVKEGFQTLIVADKNLRYQQNLSDMKLAIVELWTNHRPTLELYLAEICKKVESFDLTGYFIIEKPE